MDELDILLAELEQTSVSSRQGDPDLQTPSDYSFITASSTKYNPRALDATSPPLLQPVYQTQIDEAAKVAANETDRSIRVGSKVQESPQVTTETPLLSPKTAAQQLDDIMANLNCILSSAEPAKSAPVFTKEAAPQGAGANLDNMLGALESDLHRLGVSTDAKGVCGSCKKPIVGTIVTALGLTWHPEHFVCAHCNEEIGLKGFYERDGQAYCDKDYHALFSPRCAYCSGPILDKVLTALDKTWHPEHFFCAHCGERFGSEGYHEKGGKPYCHKDYFNMFAPKCGSCDHPVLDNYLSALNSVWHPECFVCRDCLTPFAGASFFELNGMPYCELHWHQRQGTLCSGCQKPISGRCIAALGRKFHPEHFVCAFCLKQLNLGGFKENKDKPYCDSCFHKLLGGY
ncbi:paxillin-like [Stegostoma tigrinum]|uniref:paxillin-like n=1 Tax=Stegostoma tigrinum TaxID=3053191 RepID=UPI0028704648|nr:paxillin-like [Stegostoma tigrinum]